MLETIHTISCDFADRPAFTNGKIIGVEVANKDSFSTLKPLLNVTEKFTVPWLVNCHKTNQPLYEQAITCYFLHKAIISGSGQVFIENRLLDLPEFLPNYCRNLLNIDSGGSESFHYTQKLPVRNIEKPCVVLAGHGPRVYGHFLLEVLSRLFVAKRALKHANFDCGFLLDAKSSPWMIQILEQYLNIKKENIEFFDSSIERIQLNRAILPALAFTNDRFHPITKELYDELFFELSLDQEFSKIKRIFVSRLLVDNKNSPQRQCTNELNLLRIAATEYGFTPVFIETMPWRLQIALFHNAEIIMGEYGSGLHNAIFSKAGTRVGAIGHLNLVQSHMGALRDHSNAFLSVDLVGNKETNAGGVHMYSVDVDKFRLFMDALIA